MWSQIIKSLFFVFLNSQLSADQTDLVRLLVSAATVFECHHACLRVCVTLLIKVYGEKHNGSLCSVFSALSARRRPPTPHGCDF